MPDPRTFSDDLLWPYLKLSLTAGSIALKKAARQRALKAAFDLQETVDTFFAHLQERLGEEQKGNFRA